jgi:iron complex transport system ATP-binding protein
LILLFAFYAERSPADYSSVTLCKHRATPSLAREGYTVIQTTHHPEQSYLFSDRILALHEGRVWMDGTPQEVITTDVLQKLYGIDLRIVSLLEDRSRVCLPSGVIGEMRT